MIIHLLNAHGECGSGLIRCSDPDVATPYVWFCDLGLLFTSLFFEPIGTSQFVEIILFILIEAA
jgi:hypothetical protein